MHRTIRIIAALLAIVLATESIGLAIGSKDTAYCGGTVPGFEGAKDIIDGLLDTINPDHLVWTSTGKAFHGKTITIPYDRIIDLEYGQKAGRRVGTAVATTILFGPIGLVSLLQLIATDRPWAYADVVPTQKIPGRYNLSNYLSRSVCATDKHRLQYSKNEDRNHSGDALHFYGQAEAKVRSSETLELHLQRRSRQNIG